MSSNISLKSLIITLITPMLFSLLSAIYLPLAAQDKALVGVRLIDESGHHPIANSVILTENGKIEKVGIVEMLAVPDGY